VRVIARWQLGELIAAAGELKNLHLGRALRTLKPGGSDTLDDWFWDDPGAFFGQAAYYLFSLVKTRSLNPHLEGMLG